MYTKVTKKITSFVYHQFKCVCVCIGSKIAIVNLFVAMFSLFIFSFASYFVMYKDFRSAVFEILSSQDDQNAILNGVVGMGRGMNEIPGTIVSVETAGPASAVTSAVGRKVSILRTVTADIETDVEAETSEIIDPGSAALTSRTVVKTPSIEVTRILDHPKSPPNNNIDLTKIPPIIWGKMK